MGRGRAKAKQTRVARDLKYRDVGTDLSQLAKELQKTGNTSHAASHSAVDTASSDAELDDDDEYAAYAAYSDDDDDEYEGGKDDGGAHRSHHREG
jgi:hypothetical protein